MKVARYADFIQKPKYKVRFMIVDRVLPPSDHFCRATLYAALCYGPTTLSLSVTFMYCTEIHVSSHFFNIS